MNPVFLGAEGIVGYLAAAGKVQLVPGKLLLRCSTTYVPVSVIGLLREPSLS